MLRRPIGCTCLFSGTHSNDYTCVRDLIYSSAEERESSDYMLMKDKNLGLGKGEVQQGALLHKAC